MYGKLINYIIKEMEKKAHVPTVSSHAQWVTDCIEYVKKLLDTENEMEIESYCSLLITKYCESLWSLYNMNMIMFTELYLGTFAYAEGIGALQ